MKPFNDMQKTEKHVPYLLQQLTVGNPKESKIKMSGVKFAYC